MADQKKPNCLVIWGDDIGISNLSCYSSGLMGYRTPTLTASPRRGDAVYRLLRRAELHGRARSSFITGQSCLPHRPLQGRHPCLAVRPAGRGRDHRRAAQAAWLCDRTVRQEPPRRSEQFLPTVHGFDEFFGNLYHLNAEEEPEMHELSAGEGFPGFHEAVWTARRDPFVGDRRGRRDRRAALGAGRQAADRGHRTAHQEADGNDRRRVGGGGQRLHQAAASRPAHRSSPG